MKRKEAIQILSTRDAHGVMCGYTSGVTEALDMAIEALQFAEHFNLLKEYQSLQEVVRCNDCKWYQGVHGVQGHAPCELFNKQVLWNDFCSNGEPYKGGDDK